MMGIYWHSIKSVEMKWHMQLNNNASSGKMKWHGHNWLLMRARDWKTMKESRINIQRASLTGRHASAEFWDVIGCAATDELNVFESGPETYDFL